MIAVANSKGESEYLNQRAFDYLDTTPDEFSDRPMTTVHPKDQELLRGEWQRSNAIAQVITGPTNAPAHMIAGRKASA